MPYHQRAREDAENAYYRSVANLKRTLSDPDIEFLYQYQPVGIDAKGNVLLRPERGTVKPPPHYKKLLKDVSADIALHSRHNLIIGVSLQHYSNSCANYSPYKKTLYLPRYFINMTLPHRRVKGVEFERKNGGQLLTLSARTSIGLPYGVYARLVLIYITSERVRTNERTFSLGASWRKFLEEMQIPWSGSNTGGLKAAKEQLRRLCGTLYQIEDERRSSERRSESFSNLLVADDWMRSKDGVEVTLSPGFFMMTGDSIVPLESHIVQKLRRSPLTLDLYAWLSYRLFRLKVAKTISWQELELQFGADYGRPVDFRRAFRKSLEQVLQYKPPTPVVQVLQKGLHIKPGAASDVEWMERMIVRARSSTRHPTLI